MNAIAEPIRLSIEQLRELLPEAQSEASASGRRLMEVLEQRSGLPSEEFVWDLGAVLRFQVLHMGVLHRLQPAFDLLPFAEALHRECVLLRRADGGLVFAFSNPFDSALRAWAEERVPQAFVSCLVHHADLAAFLSHHEKHLSALESMAADGMSSEGAIAAVEDLSLRTISEDTSPVVKLVNSTLYDALKAGASDIHLEAVAGGMLIKYRIDGVLTSVSRMAGQELAEQVISRVKVMSELDIAERRVPQDGRFKVAAGGREIDVRVSVMPSIAGEDAVLRVLDKQQLSDEAKGLRLDSLGFDRETLTVLRRLSREPYGMVLVTGPTGSGKTTTLYAAVTEINHGGDKIITIEDPVEYRLPGVLQIPVNEKKGLTFARGLRSILRHDPDKILVGEIRDPETAQIAVQAALTGHLVFTTVHANNVFDVIGRFMHMGVDPYSFVSALNGVIAQRLVRVLCRACSEPAMPDAQLLADSGLHAAELQDFDFRAGRGCAACRGTGYRGRKAIAEYLILTDEIREMIIARESIRCIKQTVREQGTRFLRDAAVDAVRHGETDLKEINRVTFVA
ncbi:MAG TPA: GspE/PulE family protein [Burkholderiales bacterium]|nr:GspE/PulE family protein [Burkholderiales bacterium]